MIMPPLPGLAGHRGALIPTTIVVGYWYAAPPGLIGI